jgi:hypothetical protein
MVVFLTPHFLVSHHEYYVQCLVLSIAVETGFVIMAHVIVILNGWVRFALKVECQINSISRKQSNGYC